MTACNARYEGGQMVCNQCGYVWDIDDEKPGCKVIESDSHDEQMRKITEILNDD